MTSNQPTCYVIAGPNGAGKTTFAMWYLPRVAHCVVYMGLANYVAVWDNSEERPRRVYERDEDGETVLDEDIWKRIKECVA